MEFAKIDEHQPETQQFANRSAADRIRLLFEQFDPDQILVTSSFGTHAVVLLHLLYQVRPGHPVWFINTRFHFPETLEYKEQLRRLLNLQVKELAPAEDLKELCEMCQMWERTPNVCCFLNKVAPLRQVKEQHKVWLSGLMGFQNPTRRNLPIFTPDGATDGLLKFHPLIDWSEEQYHHYRRQYNLPAHPLEAQGFGSVGCTHCTHRGYGRSGRWKEHFKTECGLHVKILS